jgi:hypothetical protein
MANEHIFNNDVQVSGSLNVSQSISASAFYGDGSNLLYVTASSQWDGIITGSVDISGSLRVDRGNVDLRFASGVSGSFSGSFSGNGSNLTSLNLNGYQASGSNFTGSFTGSFSGNGSGLTGVTASFFTGSVTNATSASFASTASYWSGSIASSSYAISSSYAATASYWSGSFTSAQTASYVNPLIQDVVLTGSLDITGSQTVSSTLQVTGKIQSVAGVDIVPTNGIHWKAGGFNTTALGSVIYDDGIGFFSNGLVTPRMYISSSGNTGIGTATPTLGKLQVEGNIHATSITSSLLGTASYASQALSASWAPVQVSASYATISNQATSASFATTASYFNTSGLTTLTAFNTFTGSFNTGSYTGSFTGNGSGLTGIAAEWDGSLSGSASITGSLIVTDTITANLFVGDGSGITGIVSPTAITATFAISASYTEAVGFASSSISASFAENSNTASIATSAFFAESSNTASIATSASYAATASFIQTASYALQAGSSSFATNAATASHLLGSVTASYSNFALSASYAQSASYIDVIDVPTGTGPYYPLFTDGTINNAIYIDSTLYSYNATTNTLTVTASRAVSASHALTASYYNGSVASASYAQTASYYNGSVASASYAQTASYYNGSVVSASYAQTASIAPGYLPLTGGTVAGDLTVTGNLTAQQYIISSSVTYFTESFSSGSTRFGDTLDDTHQFTGSLSITGSLQVGNNSAAASISNVGSLRYRTSGNNSYVDMSMQTGASTYEWVNIVQNNW